MGVQADSVGREGLKSRLGFLMVAAGCAVGLGNVWRFPFIVGRNGGAAFVLVYLVVLALLGFPLLTAELAMGRAARRGISGAMRELAVARHRRFWSIAGGVIFAGNFLLMIYYTDVAGWLLKFSGDYLRGTLQPDFAALLKDHTTCTCFLLLAVAVATVDFHPPRERRCSIATVGGRPRSSRTSGRAWGWTNWRA